VQLIERAAELIDEHKDIECATRYNHATLESLSVCTDRTRTGWAGPTDPLPETSVNQTNWMPSRRIYNSRSLYTLYSPGARSLSLAAGRQFSAASSVQLMTFWHAVSRW